SWIAPRGFGRNPRERVQMNGPGGPRGLVVLVALMLAILPGASDALPIPTTSTLPSLSTTTVVIPTTTITLGTTLTLPLTTTSVTLPPTTPTPPRRPSRRPASPCSRPPSPCSSRRPP